VVHAAPLPDPIRPVGPTSYWAATYIRLIIDPSTLTPYLREARYYWYVSNGTGASDRVSCSQTVSATYTYPSG
jgi:hypothetical protein